VFSAPPRYRIPAHFNRRDAEYAEKAQRRFH
jgi:hypothetical protein